jgi:phosphohistidine phosphatase
MKHLILMRHASALPGDDDRERPLSAAGLEEAQRVGRALEALAGRGLRPEHALVSPARRARETLAAVQGALSGAVSVEEDEALYGASRSQLLARLQAVSSTASGLLLIGHNPGLAELVDWLVVRAEPEAAGRAARGLVPAACAALRVASTRWSELAPHGAELVAFLHPRDL